MKQIYLKVPPACDHCGHVPMTKEGIWKTEDGRYYCDNCHAKIEATDQD